MPRPLRPTVEALEWRGLLSQMAAASAISVTITVDRRAYRPGQVVWMTCTETNISGADLEIDTGPSVQGFTVVHQGVTVWRSNSGAVPDFILAQTLAPGASLTVRSHWRAPRNPGVYIVQSQAAPDGPVARFEVGLGRPKP